LRTEENENEEEDEYADDKFESLSKSQTGLS